MRTIKWITSYKDLTPIYLPLGGRCYEKFADRYSIGIISSLIENSIKSIPWGLNICNKKQNVKRNPIRIQYFFNYTYSMKSENKKSDNTIFIKKQEFDREYHAFSDLILFYSGSFRLLKCIRKVKT